MTHWMDELDSAFKETPAAESGTFDKLPVGVHEATIEKVDVEDERPLICWHLYFPSFDVKRRKFSSISTNGMPFFKLELEKLNLEFKSLPDMYDNLAAMATGLKVNVYVSNRKDDDKYQNFSFNEVVGRDREVSANAITEDDLPF